MAVRSKHESRQQQVTTGRFEIEQDGKIAFLEYSIAGDVIALLHTEVPHELRGRGLASELAQTALQWAREHHVKVDVICPFVAEYLQKHHEFADLVLS